MTDGPAFFDKMLGYRQIVENVSLPESERIDAVYSAFEMLRSIYERGETDEGHRLHPDYKRMAYYASVLIPDWISALKLDVDGANLAERKNSRPTDGPKIV